MSEKHPKRFQNLEQTRRARLLPGDGTSVSRVVTLYIRVLGPLGQAIGLSGAKGMSQIISCGKFRVERIWSSSPNGSRYKIPTSGPKECNYDLLWAFGTPNT